MGLFTKKKEKDAEAHAEVGKDESKKGGGFLKGLMRKKDKAVVTVAASTLCPEASAAAELPSVEDSAAVETLEVQPAVLSAASTQFCKALGINSAGLVAAAQAHPEAVAQILEGAWEACNGAKSALGNCHNCQALADALKEAVMALDAHGQRFSQLPADQAEKLAAQYAAGAKLVQEAGTEGWLLRLAFGARAGPEAFSEVHSAVAEIVQTCVPAPAARHLQSLDYRDTSRALRRLLKRLGSGSTVAGLRAVAEGGDDEGSAQEEVAKLLEVNVQAVVAELAACEDLEAAASAAGAGSIIFDGTIRDREFALVFSTYAATGEGEGPATVSIESFARMLEDVGMAGSEDPALVNQQFALACSGESMGFEAFCEYYQSLPLSMHRQAIRAELGVEAERSLRATFSQFAAFGSGAADVIDSMDSMRFAKLCKESGLTDKVGLPAQAIDVIFTQAKPREGRRLDFDGFITALALAAKQAGCSLEAVAQAVLAVEGPALNATQADMVPLHDDKSLYTGVYRNGISVVDRPADSLAALVSREGGPSSPSKSAALSRASSGVAGSGGMTPRGGLTPISLSRTASGARSGAHTPRGSSGAGTPLARAGSGLRPPGSLGQASGPSSGAGTPTAAVAGSSAPVPSLRLQLQKLQQQQKVEQQGSMVGGREKGGVASVNKPTPRSARAPTAAAGRSPATGAAAKSTPRDRRPKTVDSHPVTPSSFGVSPISGELLTSPPAPSDIYEPELRRVFEAYASFGAGAAAGDAATAGLDGARFAKLCRESGLLNKSLNPTRVDLVFTKVAGKARRIDLRQFGSALGQLAEARGCSVVEVKRAIASSEGPQRRGTTPEAVRLHDDKTTFTGVYARGGPSTVDDKLTLEALTSRLSPRNTAPPPRARPSPRG